MIITVTTCGTSILTRRLRPQDYEFLAENLEEKEFTALIRKISPRDYNKLMQDRQPAQLLKELCERAYSKLNENANLSEQEYPEDEKKNLFALAEIKRKLITLGDENFSRWISAELNGFIGYYKREGVLNNAKQDNHYLIHTDTYQGKITADLLVAWFEAHGIKNVHAVKIDNLNTRSASDFRKGIDNLIVWCNETLSEYRQINGWKVIFNLVGGFKALQGYMQTLGMFYASETIYIFESSNELLTIPQLPVDFAAQTKETLLHGDNFTVFRKLCRLYSLSDESTLSVEECKGLPLTLLSVEDSKCSLSSWGLLIWENIWREQYSKCLLPPLTKRIKYSDEVIKQAEEYITSDNKRLVWLNERLDDLYIEVEKGIRIDSCNLRALKTDPSVYEFNLWRDQAGWGGYCHKENNNDSDGKATWIIDRIGEGIGKAHHGR